MSGAGRVPLPPEFRDDPVAELLRDPERLEGRLREIDIVPVLLVYTHLSGDPRYLDAFAPHVKGAWGFEVDAPEALQEELRRALVATLEDYRTRGRPLPPAPPEPLLQRMCDVAVGGKMPAEYLPLVREELNFDRGDAKTVRWRGAPPRDRLEAFHVVVIGAGFSGVAMATKLADAGIPFTVIEKNDDVGGTWHENTYPGVAVDTPNHFYSYSFRVEPEWNHYFARGADIREYIRRCFAERGLAPLVRFREEVTHMRWDAQRALWTLTVRRRDGFEYRLRANVVVSGTGLLNRPAYPDIPGIDRFRGPIFHNARWDHGVDLAGKRVALVGTGASGMQIGVAIAPLVERLTIFQRSPHWARPNPLIHARVGEAMKWALANIPFYNKWYRFLLLWASADGILPSLRKDPGWHEPRLSLNAKNHEVRELLIRHMREQLGGDETLLSKVTPSFPPYGKRMLRDGGWFRMLTRGNVELVDGPIRSMDETGITDRNGAHHPQDVVVLATGFRAQAPLFPMEVVGRNGSLRDHWGEDNPRAYLGITVPGFPNLFLLYGPNTNGAHGGSAVFMSECQVRYVMLALREMLESGAASAEVRQAPFEDYNAAVDAEHAQLVWTHPGVNNWYRNSRGRVVTNLPWTLCRYRNLTAEFRAADYHLHRG